MVPYHIQQQNIVFVIDSSRSMTTDNFENSVLEFIKRFVAAVPDVGEDSTRFALVTYSTKVSLTFNYAENGFDRAAIILAVDNAVHMVRSPQGNILRVHVHVCVRAAGLLLLFLFVQHVFLLSFLTGLPACMPIRLHLSRIAWHLHHLI